MINHVLGFITAGTMQAAASKPFTDREKAIAFAQSCITHGAASATIQETQRKMLREGMSHDEDDRWVGGRGKEYWVWLPLKADKRAIIARIDEENMAAWYASAVAGSNDL